MRDTAFMGLMERLIGCAQILNILTNTSRIICLMMMPYSDTYSKYSGNPRPLLMTGCGSKIPAFSKLSWFSLPKRAQNLKGGVE